MDNTQLTDALTYNVANLRFRKMIESTLPGANGAPSVNYKRVPIGTRNPDGTFGDLILPTLRLYSFGLSANVSPNTGKIDSYTLPLCLTNRNDPTVEEKKWVETFNRIVEATKDHIIEKKDEYGRYDLERVELKKLNPIWYKTEKGKIVDGAAPVLYAKVMMNKKTGKISTLMTNGATGEELDPLTLANKPCYVEAAVKIESIYMGAKISLQVKVQEANIFLIDNTPKRLLRRPVAVQQVEMDDDVPEEAVSEQAAQPASSSAAEVDMSDDDDSGSIKASDDENEEEAPAPPVVEEKKAVVRRPLAKKK